jgi:aminopeptidase YwaD
MPVSYICRHMFSVRTLLCLLIIVVFSKEIIAGPGNEKEVNQTLLKLRQDVEYLASADLQGRLTGTDGEQKAATYIESRFRNMGIQPYKNKYQWAFTANVGTRIGSNAYFSVFNTRLNLNSDLVFLPYSKGNTIFGSVYPKVYEENQVWLVPMSEARVIETNDFQKRIYDYARDCMNRKSGAVVFYNDIGTNYDFSPLNLNQYEALSIPVAIMNHKAYLTHLKANMHKDWIEIDAKLGYENANTTGTNVIAMIDNKAPLTIVIAAHYDHLGEGYPGADDNASGIAALLQIAEQISSLKLNRYNFLFAAFSGKEQDHQGSKAFIKQNEHQLNAFAAMIDLDMLGRYNQVSKELFIGGGATSPYWIPALQKINKGYVLKIDSSGTGYSDYSVFYQNNVPALRLSTGYHNDYMKNTDVATRINYSGLMSVIQYVSSLLTDMNLNSKPVFTKTNDYIPRIESLKTNLGIIPDNSFEQNGIRVGACLPNKMAEKAGILNGDIISKIGEFIIVDMNDYIEALTKTDKGKETTIIVKRDKYEFKFFVVL